ncbi:MAG TPA: glycosyltransferase family 2 protein [Candidatus Nanoarchaeia archaeon]|nr:glycosyltransferase family 2 protein [Candidatus Nanoarchaeia archaeon]
METITALVAVKNEEKNIRRCLKSVNWVNNLIIIDSGSTDNTLKIAKEFHVRIYQFRKKNYLLREKLNFGIRKIKKGWILIVDADEEVTPKLKTEIIRAMKNIHLNAFNICFHNYCFGRFLKGFYWNDMPVTRLFRSGKATYEDIEPHRSISIDGKIGNLKGYINHYPYNNTKEFLNKAEKYTSLSAPLIIKNNGGGILNKPLGSLGIYSSYIEPVIFSVWIFLRKGMYKDYFLGLWLSLLMGYYLYIERKKVRMLKNGNKSAVN